MNRLKMDRRRSLMSNIEANGLSSKRKLNKGSGQIKIRERLLKKAKAEGNTEKVQKLEKELKELYNRVQWEAGFRPASFFDLSP